MIAEIHTKLKRDESVCVAVLKHPYLAVTQQDGTFDLSKLLPGTYSIKTRHEKLGTATRVITVGRMKSRPRFLLSKQESVSIVHKFKNRAMWGVRIASLPVGELNKSVLPLDCWTATGRLPMANRSIPAPGA